MSGRSRNRPPRGCARQTGLSLIEMMVALLIASLLMLALVVVFLSGRSSFLTQEQMARMQENGRFAFKLLTRDLQNAGHRREVWDVPSLGFAFTANTVDGGGTAPDTVELQFESDRDCEGNYNSNTVNVPLPGGGTATRPRYDQKLVNFTVTGDTLVYSCSYGPANGTLVTQINNASVADGIENLQIQYGEDQTGNTSVNQWVDAGDWTNAFDVVAVRVALMVRTPETFTTEQDTQTFDLYGATTTASNDRRIRKMYAGEVNLRNLTL